MATRMVMQGSFGFSLLQYAFHRSEEHTSELQSLTNLVCRLLLENKREEASPLSQSQTRIPANGENQLRSQVPLTRFKRRIPDHELKRFPNNAGPVAQRITDSPS